MRGFETGNIRGNEAKGAGLEFWGGSFMADPFGASCAGSYEPGRDFDCRGGTWRKLEDIRRNWPFCAISRIDSSHLSRAG